MKQKYATRKAAIEVIREIKEEGSTNYFAGTIRFEDMQLMLRYRMNFGDAETRLILAALVNAGAKFAL